MHAKAYKRAYCTALKVYNMIQSESSETVTRLRLISVLFRPISVKQGVNRSGIEKAKPIICTLLHTCMILLVTTLAGRLPPLQLIRGFNY